MLSLDKCRSILGVPDMSDEEIETIRDQCRQIALLLIDKYYASKKQGDGKTNFDDSER
jgi:hypothetical protein